LRALQSKQPAKRGDLDSRQRPCRSLAFALPCVLPGDALPGGGHGRPLLRAPPLRASRGAQRSPPHPLALVPLEAAQTRSTPPRARAFPGGSLHPQAAPSGAVASDFVPIFLKKKNSLLKLHLANPATRETNCLLRLFEFQQARGATRTRRTAANPGRPARGTWGAMGAAGSSAQPCTRGRAPLAPVPRLSHTPYPTPL